MRIHNVEMVRAVGSWAQLPEDGRPELAFVGRSNVGKSSLLNYLIGRKALARTSNTPGKTTTLNFYLANADQQGQGGFCLVDLPGYGFARVPKAVREKWRPLINAYLTGPTPPVGVVQLIDMRHGPSEEDLHSIEYLAELGLPVFFVLTKADKLKATQRAKMMERIPARLGVEADQVLPVSAHSGMGMGELLETVGALLEVNGTATEEAAEEVDSQASNP